MIEKKASVSSNPVMRGRGDYLRLSKQIHDWNKSSQLVLRKKLKRQEREVSKPRRQKRDVSEEQLKELKKREREQKRETCNAIEKEIAMLDRQLHTKGNKNVMGSDLGSWLGPTDGFFKGKKDKKVDKKRVADRKARLEHLMIDMGCASLDFDEIQERLDEVNAALDRNFDQMKESMDKIDRNFEAIQQVDEKVDRNMGIMVKGFENLERKLEQRSADILDGLENLRIFFRKSQIEAVTSKLISYIDWFVTVQSALEDFTDDQLVAKFQSQNHMIYESTMTLHQYLTEILSQNFAIPENETDAVAFAALDLLYSGVQTYASILVYLTQSYTFLANHHYKRLDLEKYNESISLSLVCFKEFSELLNGIENQNGLLQRVVGVLSQVQARDFVSEDLNLILGVEKKVLMTMRAQIADFEDLPDEIKITNEIELDFQDSNVTTPILNWKPFVSVRYAIQHENAEELSIVSDWSEPYEIEDLANPVVHIGKGEEGKKRLVFRKFSGKTPELVFSTDDKDVSSFRDIDRDLFNVVSFPEKRRSLANLEVLIENGGNVNAKFQKGLSLLHVAVRKGNLKMIQALVEAGADIDVKDDEGESPIYVAAQLGQVGSFQYLLEKGADLLGKTKMDWGLIHAAVYSGNQEIVTTLLERKLSLWDLTSGDFNVLHIASTYGVHNLAAFVLEKSAEVINDRSEEGLAPLHLAAIQEDLTLATFLLQQEALDVNLKTKGGLSALHFAANLGNLEIVRLLLAHEGVNVNLKTDDGWTALHLAILFDKEAVVDELLARTDLDVSIRGQGEVSFLHLAAYKSLPRVIEVLLQKGAHTEAREKSFYTPLLVAVESGFLDCVKVLVEVGKANLNARQKDGHTAVSIAMTNTNFSVLKYLIDAGANVDIANDFNMTPLEVAGAKGLLPELKLLEKVNPKVNFTLHWASYGGFLLVVQALVENSKANIHLRDRLYRTPIFYAVEQGQFSVVQYLFEKKADIFDRDLARNSLVHAAVQSGYLGIVQFVLSQLEEDEEEEDNVVENDPRPFHDEPNLYGETPFLLACALDAFDIVKYFVDHLKVDVDSKDLEGNSGLHLSARKGNFRGLKFLIARGAKSEVNVLGKTPLLEAAENGKWEIVEYLFKNNYDLISDQQQKDAALRFAARDGRVEFMDNLIKYDAGVDSPDPNGWTPVHFGARFGQSEALRLLIDANAANFLSPDKAGMSVLHLAVLSEDMATIRYFVEEKEVKVTIPELSFYPSTPLHLAVENNSIEEAKYLIEKGAIINALDGDEATPLLLAAHRELWEMAEFLIERGANVLEADVSGSTALHYAALSGNLEISRVLVSKGAKVNISDDDGRTCLHQAALSTNLELLEFLVEEALGDLAVLDNDGNSPLHFAALAGSFDSVLYLVQKGADFELKNKAKNTPYTLTGSFEIAKFFIDEKGVTYDPNLFGAVKKNQLGILKYIVAELDGNPEAQDAQGKSPLHHAAELGYLETVRYLVSEKFVSINVEDSDGKVPLHYAAKEGHGEVIAYLHQMMAEETVAAEFTSPFVAAENDYSSIVKFLVEEKNVPKNATDPSGYSILYRAASKGGLSTARYLLEEQKLECGRQLDLLTGTPVESHLTKMFGAGKAYGDETWDRSKYWADCFSPLTCSARNGHQETFKFLLDRECYLDLDRGIDFSAVLAGHEGHEGLLKYLIDERVGRQVFIDKYVKPKPEKFCAMTNYAVERGHKSVVEYLLGHVKFDCGPYFLPEWTLLHGSAVGGYVDVVRYVKGNTEIDVNALDKGGNTSLMLAAKRGHLDTVKYLVEEEKANVQLQNGQGNTAYQLALQNGHTEVAEYLKSKEPTTTPAPPPSQDREDVPNRVRRSLEASSWLNSALSYVESGLSRARNALLSVSEDSKEEKPPKGTSWNFCDRFSSEACVQNNAVLSLFVLQKYLDVKMPLPEWKTVDDKEAFCIASQIVSEVNEAWRKTGAKDVEIGGYQMHQEVLRLIKNGKCSKVPALIRKLVKESTQEHEVDVSFLEEIFGAFEKN